MNHTPVKSSNVKSIAHDPATGTLEVAFLNGSVYQYDGVPASIHDALLETHEKGGSVGGHFDRTVKKAGYPCRKVG